MGAGDQKDGTTQTGLPGSLHPLGRSLNLAPPHVFVVTAQPRVLDMCPAAAKLARLCEQESRSRGGKFPAQPERPRATWWGWETGRQGSPELLAQGGRGGFWEWEGEGEREEDAWGEEGDGGR